MNSVDINHIDDKPKTMELADAVGMLTTTFALSSLSHSFLELYAELLIEHYPPAEMIDADSGRSGFDRTIARKLVEIAKKMDIQTRVAAMVR